MLEIETVVVGAGVVGLAVARALALAGREVLVLERARKIGSETSSRNSEVIHSGIYYTPGSLKAALCVAGRDLLYQYCQRRDVQHRRVGKLIVATEAAEVAVLEKYVALAAANGVGALTRLDADAVHAMEPGVRCVQGLHSPYTGIVDSHELMTAFWGDLQNAGGQIAFGAELRRARRTTGGVFELEVDAGEDAIACRELINCAGLSAPDLARRFAGCDSVQVPAAHYARGHYYTLRGPAPFSRLVYPVAEAAGLGIHVTLDLAGKVRFGPDVEWVSHADYEFDERRRDRFAAAIRRYYPALDADRLEPAYVGVRPKISGPGEPGADFRIDGPAAHGVHGLVHLFGIESPGLTSSLAIAERVRQALA